jgi:ParB family chromosome partitioning protein
MVRELRDKLQFSYIKLDEIDVSESNVRKSNLEEGIEELANSIREIGVRQPVTVFKKDGRYELIIGQRRYLASRRAGEVEIPAVIVKAQDRTDALIKSLSENIHRRELDYRDKMQAALELRDKLKSIDVVAKHLGVSPQTVRNYFGYAAVPDKIKGMVADKKLSASFAMRISRKIPDEELAFKVAEQTSKMPRSQEKNAFIDLVGEKPQEKNFAKLLNEARRKAQMKKITIHVTQSVYDAILKASKEYGSDHEGVVKEAVEEWLTNRGFIK